MLKTKNPDNPVTHPAANLGSSSTDWYSILRKFSLSRRSELQHILSDWDFSAWQD